MKAGEVVAIITGLTAFIATITGTWYTARRDRAKAGADNAAVLLGGWKDFQGTTQVEMARMRTVFQDEIRDLKAEFEAKEQKWNLERIDLMREIEQLKAQVLILIREGQRER